MHNLFGEISIQTFLKEYWQKKPLLVRNAFPNFESFISAEELAGLACEAMVESRLISYQSDNDTWQTKHGPFLEDSFSSLPTSHWTLLVQAVDQWLPEAHDFMQQFNFIPNWRRDDLMISYATEQGGTGPHYDNYDVFLIQAAGKREWQIGGLYNEHSPRRNDTEVKILTDFKAEATWHTNAGDMLYLPPQVGHNGIALDNDCMTYSVGFRAPSHAEIINSFADFISENLEEEQRYTDPDLVLQKNSGEINNNTIEKLKNILTACVNDEEKLSEWFGTYMTTPKYFDQSIEQRELVDCTVEDIANHLNKGCIIKCNEGSRFSYIARGKIILFFSDGKKFTCQNVLFSLIEKLCESKPISLSDIDGSHKKAKLQLLQQLVEQDSIYLLLD